ncbi:MAG: glycosyltransferase family 4 protein [Bacteroidota bacterium]
MGTAILDAYAARVPVVATRTGGIPEMIHEEQSGLLADVGKPQQLAQQVMRILGDPDFADQLRDGGWQQLTGHFSHERMVQKTLQVYREVLAE